MNTAKPFTIPKRLVHEAFKAVKANAGSAGVDQETIEDFEADLKNNLSAQEAQDTGQPLPRKRGREPAPSVRALEKWNRGRVCLMGAV